MTKLAALVAFCFLAALSSAGCGRYKAARPPEDFSPREIKNLQVQPLLQGVRFRWESPDKDMRGKDLKTIDGYNIYRKELLKEGDLVDESVEFELLEKVQDIHLLELEKKREEAREAGRPSRRITVESSLQQFEYTDITVQPGHAYAYQIIPINQDGVKGEYTQIIRVLFRGDSSEVTMVPVSAFDEEGFAF